MNNVTLFTADRGTHAKIVVVALAASIAVYLIGIQVKPLGSEPLHRSMTGFVAAAVGTPPIRIHATPD